LLIQVYTEVDARIAAILAKIGVSDQEKKDFKLKRALNILLKD